MAGTRQPTAVVVANGKKHFTQTELDQRLDAEIKIPTSTKATPPKWLPDRFRSDFRRIGKKLIAANLFADLDADTLGRYLVAREQWRLATEKASDALKEDKADNAQAWSSIQDRYFKQCRACATDMGLTISSRCRLVIPQAVQAMAADEEESTDEFSSLLKARQRAATMGIK